MIDYNLDENIAILTFNQTDSAVNTINEATMLAFKDALDKAISDENVQGIILTSAKKAFVVGADLNMVLGIDDPQEIMDAALGLHELLRELETSGKPAVAAINGTALGGGYEICLACHHRIAVNDSKIEIGLPEVLLGLLPGGGGCQRLPRLIGIQNALRPLLEGQKMRPKQALQNGLIDEVVETKEELITAAKKWINEVGEKVQPWDKNGYKIPGGKVTHPNNVMVLAAAAGLLKKKTYGNYPAPIAILNAVYEGLQLEFEKALKVEARYFAQCVTSDIAKNMIRTLFFNLNEANKGGARPKDVPETNIQKIGILGAGMMGAGIAYVSANVGLEVVLKDVSMEAAEKGKAYSKGLLDKKLSKGFISQEKSDDILGRIKTTDKPADIAGCDLVIEAVFENRELKATITKESEAVLDEKAVFASNTSTLPITGLAEASVRPENFIGLHFFSPVDKMPLVEIIVGEKTADYAIAMCIDYVRKIKKTPIVVNDSRGFYTSRVFSTYIFEGLELLAEGVPAAVIENAGKMAGMPVGPLAVADEVSIELCYKINKQTEADLGIKNESAAIDVVNKFIEELDRPGKKDKKGFYEYPEGAKKFLWPELKNHFPENGNLIDIEEVKRRLLHRQALETVKCFEENVLTKPADADIGSIFGWGFAPYSGGALSYIDWVGVDRFVRECEELAAKYGERFQPTERLKEMAANGEKFHEELKPVVEAV